MLYSWCTTEQERYHENFADVYKRQIEGFNRQLRKVTKSKSVFPTDGSLLKNAVSGDDGYYEKMDGRRQDWSRIHAQLSIYFAERMPD